jgi:hypothetical protein
MPTRTLSFPAHGRRRRLARCPESFVRAAGRAGVRLALGRPDLRRRALAGRVHRSGGVHGQLQEWPRVIHVWHWHWPMLDDGESAVRDIGNFLRAQLVQLR